MSSPIVPRTFVLLTALSAGGALAGGPSYPIEQRKLVDDVTPSAAHAGFSVAVSGSTAVFGAPDAADPFGLGSPGAALVHVRGGPASDWQPQARIPNFAPVGKFGFAVAIDGDTLAVGSPLESTAPGHVEGAVHVFTRTNGLWTPQAVVSPTLPSGIASGWAFGVAIELEGDTLVVGANMVNTFPSPGALFVFERVGGVWSQTQMLTAAFTTPSLYLGTALSLDGDRLVTGAPGSANAYVFEKSGGTWSQAAVLQPAGGGVGTEFGAAVALDGTVCAIGAPAYFNATGQVTIFQGAGSSWAASTPFSAPFPGALEFGHAVEVVGDRVLVGAPASNGMNPNTGATFDYTLSGATVALTDVMFGSDGYPGDRYGAALAADPGAVVVGAPYQRVAVPQSPWFKWENGAAYIHTDPDASRVYGAGCLGVLGEVPTLGLAGKLEAGGTVSLHIGDALGGSSAFLFLGAGPGEFPTGFGCTLNVSGLSSSILGPIPLTPLFGADGFAKLTIPLPAGPYPPAIAVQAFIVDPYGVAGYSNTNGCELR